MALGKGFMALSMSNTASSLFDFLCLLHTRRIYTLPLAKNKATTSYLGRRRYEIYQRLLPLHVGVLLTWSQVSVKATGEDKDRNYNSQAPNHDQWLSSSHIHALSSSSPSLWTIQQWILYEVGSGFYVCHKWLQFSPQPGGPTHPCSSSYCEHWKLTWMLLRALAEDFAFQLSEQGDTSSLGVSVYWQRAACISLWLAFHSRS